MKVEIEQEKHLMKKLLVNYKVKSKVLSHGCNGSTDLKEILSWATAFLSCGNQLLSSLPQASHESFSFNFWWIEH